MHLIIVYGSANVLVLFESFAYPFVAYPLKKIHNTLFDIFYCKSNLINFWSFVCFYMKTKIVCVFLYVIVLALLMQYKMYCLLRIKQNCFTQMHINSRTRVIKCIINVINCCINVFNTKLQI